MRTALTLIVILPLIASVQAKPTSLAPLEIVVFSSGWTDESVRATPEKPVYYVPMAGGYYTEGPPVAGDKSELVKMEQIWVPLCRTLARQGYLPATKGTPKATQLVVFHWGVMHPNFLIKIDEAYEDYEEEFLNNKNMGLLVGNTRVDRHLDSEFGKMYQNATERRYFIVVSAFDYAAATARKKEKKILWRTRLSVPLLDTNLEEAIAPLIAAGAPFYGRDSGQPKEFRWDRTKVEVGDSTVVREAKPTSAASEATPPLEK
jgi:hypothetical protein